MPFTGSWLGLLFSLNSAFVRCLLWSKIRKINKARRTYGEELTLLCVWGGACVQAMLINLNSNSFVDVSVHSVHSAPYSGRPLSARLTLRNKGRSRASEEFSMRSKDKA